MPTMNLNGKFTAPWGRELRWMTAVAVAICVGVGLIGLVSLPENHPIARWNMVAIPLLILLGGACFMVRGYSLGDGQLIIHRLGWTCRLDLASLKSAAYDPSAMEKSIRIAGNGGLFAFCGQFRNQKLGNYRVFGTDVRRSVVLRFLDRVVVVTPDAPERFVAEITKLG
ncbi:MAG: hypothetical protein JWQ71_3620 [Pedosphaera sp.]|nr:hypothetical protein [Pedosphaera sp.]